MTKRDSDYAFYQEAQSIADNGIVIRMSVDEARKLFDQVEDEELGNAIDEAQGAVGTGDVKRAWIVIVIDKEQA